MMGAMVVQVADLGRGGRAGASPTAKAPAASAEGKRIRRITSRAALRERSTAVRGFPRGTTAPPWPSPPPPPPLLLAAAAAAMAANGRQSTPGRSGHTAGAQPPTRQRAGAPAGRVRARAGDGAYTPGALASASVTGRLTPRRAGR